MPRTSLSSSDLITRNGELKWKWAGASNASFFATLVPLPTTQDKATITEEDLIQSIFNSTTVSESDKTKTVRLVWTETEESDRKIELKINIGTFKLLESLETRNSNAPG